MSVRANLEPEMTGLALAGGAGAASNVKAAGMSFRDSWHAQVSSMHQADAPGEADLKDAEAVASAALPLREGGEVADGVASAAKCANAPFRFQQLAAGLVGPADVAKGMTEKSGLAASGVRGQRPAGSKEGDTGKRSSHGPLASEAVGQVSMISNEIAAPPQPSPLVVPGQADANLAPSRSLKTGSKNSSTESSALGSTSSLDSVSQFREGSALPVGDIAAEANAATAGADIVQGSTLEQPVFTGRPSVTGILQQSPGPAPVESRSNGCLATNETAPDSGLPVDPAAAVVEGTFKKAGENLRFGGERGTASPQLHSGTGATNRNDAADELGKESSVIAASPEARSLNADRGTEISPGPQIQVSSSGAAAFVERSNLPKSSTSRTSLNASRAESSRHAMANSLDAFVAHASGVQGSSEAANAGLASAKSGASISGNRGAEETFNALDSGSRIESGDAGLARNGRMRAEAGYQDPVLGWVGVRADASRGVVHATVLSQSVDAAQALSGHMAGLHTYLADNHTPVETLTLASFGGGQQLAGHDSGRGMQNGADRETSRDNSGPALNEPSATRATVSVANEVFARADADDELDGRRISVVA